MLLYTKITFHEYSNHQVDTIDRLLRYLPFCVNSNQRDAIMHEIRNLRKEVVEIEEMSKTEKQKYVKWKVMTIESDIN